MADTVRDLTSLLALLADNTAGDISPQDLRDTIVSLHGVYGNLRVEAGVAAQSSISTTPAKVTVWTTDGLSNGTTPDQTTDNDISVGTTGVYRCAFSVSFSGTASTKFSFEVYKNTAATGITGEITLNATPDDAHVSGIGDVSCTAADNIELYVYADGAAKSVTITEAQLTVHRIK